MNGKIGSLNLALWWINGKLIQKGKTEVLSEVIEGTNTEIQSEVDDTEIKEKMEVKPKLKSFDQEEFSESENEDEVPSSEMDDKESVDEKLSNLTEDLKIEEDAPTTDRKKYVGGERKR